MAIRGSLDTFSLPELFQIIQSGTKSGKLSFNPNSKNGGSELEGVFELWFDKGNFVGLVNSLNYQSLIADIQRKEWIESKDLIRAKYSCSKELPLGTYLQQQGFLTSSQINSLFQNQLDSVRKLFNVAHAWFKFEEVNKNSKTLEDGEPFPWKEMTGRQKRPAELSLEAMREFSDWQRFAEDLPTAVSGLQKLDLEPKMQLVALENSLWNSADGTVSLKKIAKQTSASLEEVQRTALVMILAGIVEEVPVATAIAPVATPKLKQPVLAGDRNVAVKPAVKSKVSNSLINNLVSFLKNNF